MQASYIVIKLDQEGAPVSPEEVQPGKPLHFDIDEAYKAREGIQVS